jgi:hypothetical protein
LNGIRTNELQRVFHSWIEGVENVIAAEGCSASESISCMSVLDVSSNACGWSNYLRDTLYDWFSEGMYRYPAAEQSLLRIEMDMTPNTVFEASLPRPGFDLHVSLLPP